MVEIKDIYGSVQIPQGVLWGANTQRSLQNFPIGEEKMPEVFIESFIQLKKACAQANVAKGVLEKSVGEAIIGACDQLLREDFIQHFPLSIWQTGSGTQTNMNVNEVIANIASEAIGEKVHPNDHVNKGQSSNDVFPTVMHLCAVKMVKEVLLPTLSDFKASLNKLASNYQDVIKTARTHLQDATPITFGQEASAWEFMFDQNIRQVQDTLPYLQQLVMGGTAVGTGLNSYEGFGQDVADLLNKNLEEDFVATENPFHGMSSKDALVFLHGALNGIAANAIKVANDIRWLASGPRCGLGEINIPSNEAGSSIMPGKVNPTQAEALTMVCAQVMGNNQSVIIGASQGNFQLNVYMPMILHNVWQSIRLLSDALNSFRERCLDGITVNKAKMQENLEKSLMTATYLNRRFGYDETAKLVKQAHEENKNIKDVVVEHGQMTAEEFDDFFKYEEMIRPYEITEG